MGNPLVAPRDPSRPVTAWTMVGDGPKPETTLWAFSIWHFNGKADRRYDIQIFKKEYSFFFQRFQPFFFFFNPVLLLVSSELRIQPNRLTGPSQHYLMKSCAREFDNQYIHYTDQFSSSFPVTLMSSLQGYCAVNFSQKPLKIGRIFWPM